MLLMNELTMRFVEEMALRWNVAAWMRMIGRNKGEVSSLGRMIT